MGVYIVAVAAAVGVGGAAVHDACVDLQGGDEREHGGVRSTQQERHENHAASTQHLAPHSLSSLYDAISGFSESRLITRPMGR